MDPNSITDRLANLSPAKRALFEQRLKEKALETLPGQTIPLRAFRESAPLSFAQQRLWFLNQLEPESPAYNEPRAVRLIGVLNIEALEKSLNYVIERHKVLRTTIVLVDGNPMQRVAAHRTIEMPLIDLRSQVDQERDAEARRLINEAIRHPFDLSRDLMLRVLLLRLEDEQYILVLVKHHVASDGWSTGIFWQELTALYEAYTSGRSPNLRELPVQYADYAVWQREWLRGDVLETQLSYWRRQLDKLTTLQVPTDRPRPVIQSFLGAKQTLTLPKDLSEALRALSRKEGVTLFMLLLAAFKTLLYRYTGQEDIAVGSPIAGRNRAEIEGLIGFFVNTLVLRTDVSGKLTFKELLARVRGVGLDAYSHQDLPFEKLVEDLQPQRNSNHNPLFQVIFQLNNGPRALLKLPAIQVEDMELESGISKFDLNLSMSDLGENITARLQYNTDLFDDATIRRMMVHFRNLLEGIATNPERRISELPLITEAEKHQLLVEWNDTRTDYPKNECIHGLFESQVEKTPDAIALVFEDQQLTYRELNNRANQLAHYLQKLGVGPEVLVGICVGYSIEMVIGLLGVLKAGGCYVPLDPSYPKERLSFILEDTQAAVLITQESLISRLPRQNARIVCVDRDWPRISRQSESNLDIEMSTENLAYVIYTSGSTGKPKGVAVLHRAVNRLVMNTDYAELSPADVVAQASNISFDAATFEIWGALLNGAQLVLIAKDTLLSPEAMATAIDQRGITTLFLTTALFNQMAERIPAALGKLHHLLFGGEVADPQRVRELLQKGLPKRLLHVYGPTETTTFASWYLVKGVAEEASTVPIGHPIANTEIYIVDSYLNPVPIGVAGEIYISGDGLARGYLNQAELMAEKFITHSFDGKAAKRLYRTGDLARYLADGNIEFLGRIDDQVKIRGFRIELGEVERVLAQHSSIRETVVVAREDVSDVRRLVAYVVAAQDSASSTNDLRSFLKAKLPEYMMPSTYVFLDSLPLTPNGKVDRNALPAPDQTRPELDETYSAPRTPIEEMLAGIWAEILKIDKVGIHDSFFDLGGHSLLATRVVSRIREVFRMELPLRALFEMPTVASLSDHIEAIRWAGDENQPTSKECLDQTEEIIL